MTTLKKLGSILAFWWIVAHAGQEVGGPYGILENCQRNADRLSRLDHNISSICQWREDLRVYPYG